MTRWVRSTGAYLALTAALVLANGCGQGPVEGAQSGESPPGNDLASEERSPLASPSAPSLEFRGPNGEEATPAEELSLTDEEVEQVRQGDYTAAFLWHESSSFTQAIQQGVEEQFAELGIDVVASATAGFDPAREASNVETVLATDPDVIVTIPVDPVAAAENFRPAVEQGVKLVILTIPPAGYENGTDYVGIVTGEATAYGKAAAEMLGEALGGSGKVGLIFHDAEFWFTNARDQAFKDWLAALYPEIDIVAESGFTDPARTEEITNSMLTREPDLNGLYVAWAQPAQGALAALRAAAREDIKMVTSDLDRTLALDMAQGGSIVGIVANPADDVGRKLGVMAGYGLLEKDAPEMAVVPPLAVTVDSLAEGWRLEFAEDLPEDVIEALAQ